MINIGLYSPNPQSGKSTTATYIKQKYGHESVVLANTLKRMTDVFLKDLGYNDDDRNRMIYGDLKEWIIPELGVSTRYLMITLGTDWGRGKVSNNIWIDIALRNLNPILNYISDDIRYINEGHAFRDKGFKIVRIYNPRVPVVESISEGNLEGYEFDYHITNDGSFEDLYKQIDSMMETFNTYE